MNKIVSLSLAALLCMTSAAFAGEVDPAKVPEKKRTVSQKYLTAKEAFAMKQEMGAKALMVDVRTPAEIAYVGMPEQADLNIPYMLIDFSAYDDKNNRYSMAPNSGFTSKMADALAKAGLNKESTIILSCRSGDRSANAADLLHKAGYTNVYSVVDGFEGDLASEGAEKGHRSVNGWKNAHLPYTYNVPKSKLYIE